MDNHIIDASIPSGSVILAYGSPSPRTRIPKILATIAGIFGILLGLVILCALTCNNVPLPNDTVALAYLPSGTALTEDAPAPWRDAVNADSRFPTFVGYTLQQDDSLVPFAIVPRTVSLPTEAKTFAWKLVAQQTMASEPTSFFGLPGHLTSYLRGSWLRLDWGDTHLSGTLKNGHWMTDAQLPTATNATRSFFGDGYVDLTTFPDAIAFVGGTVATLGIEAPDAFGASTLRFAHGTSSTAVVFGFEQDMTPETKVRLAEAAGLHDTVIVTLPDGSTRADLQPPTKLLAGTSSTSWTVGGLELNLTPREATFSSGLIGWNQTQVPDRCPGQLVAAFDPESQRRIQGVLRIFVPDIHSTLYWMEVEGKLHACW